MNNMIYKRRGSLSGFSLTVLVMVSSIAIVSMALINSYSGIHETQQELIRGDLEGEIGRCVFLDRAYKSFKENVNGKETSKFGSLVDDHYDKFYNGIAGKDVYDGIKIEINLYNTKKVYFTKVPVNSKGDTFTTKWQVNTTSKDKNGKEIRRYYFIIMEVSDPYKNPSTGIITPKDEGISDSGNTNTDTNPETIDLTNSQIRKIIKQV